MSVTNKYKFELEKNDIQTTVEAFKDVLKYFNSQCRFSIYFHFNEVDFTCGLFKKLDDIYHQDFITQIDGSQTITENNVEELNAKYFKLLKESQISSLSIGLGSVSEGDVDLKPSRRITFTITDSSKPSVYFSSSDWFGDETTKVLNERMESRLEFFQNCLNTLNLKGTAKLTKIGKPPADRVQVQLDQSENTVSLESMGRDSLGENSIRLTLASLDDAITLFEKLVRAHLFEVKRYKVTLGGGIRSLSEILQKNEISLTKINGAASVPFGGIFDIKILEIFSALERVNGSVSLVMPFSDFEGVKNSWGDLWLDVENNTAEIQVNLGSRRDEEKALEYLTNKTNKKLTHIGSF
jgi:hypothetical protein